MERTVRHIYLDPLDAIWLTVAERIGMRVVRSSEAYATCDGQGTLTIGSSRTLDPDDCLAQMILHELCHSLIEGPGSLALRDFGLDNETERHVPREEACLRLQAWLTEPHRLRGALAPTTEFRAFYDALGPDPLAGDDPAIALARIGAGRAGGPPWGPHLADGLRATAKVLEAARELGARDPSSKAPPIWER